MELNEQQQTQLLLARVRELRQEFSEFNSLWSLLGTTCSTLEDKVRRLELKRRENKLDEEATSAGILGAPDADS